MLPEHGIFLDGKGGVRHRFQKAGNEDLEEEVSGKSARLSDIEGKERTFLHLIELGIKSLYPRFSNDNTSVK